MSMLVCNDPLKKGCSWAGSPQELVAKTDAPEDRDFNYCPYCGASDFEEEEEEGEAE